MRSIKVVLVLIAVVFGSALPSLAADYYVNAELGSDANSGLEPADAWKTITYGLSAAICSPDDPATIHIAAGTYSASTNGDALPLEMRSFVSLAGEASEATILDAEQQAEHVILFGSVQNGAMRGLTVTGAKITSFNIFLVAGAICCRSSEVVIEDCVIVDNDTWLMGGGIRVIDSSVSIVGCTIRDNQCAGIFFSSCKGKHPRVTDCTISGNTYGGVRCWYASPLISGCDITDNHSGTQGGGIWFDDSSAVVEECLIARNSSDYLGGGGIYVEDPESDPVIIRCEIVGNCAGAGGGIMIYNGPSMTVQECTIADNHALSLSGGSGGGISCAFADIDVSDCVITGNSATSGGGIYFNYCDFPPPRVEGCVIETNEADQGGGIACIDFSVPDILDCSINQNTASRGGGIFCERSSPWIRSCKFFGNEAHPVGGAMAFTHQSDAIVEDCELAFNVSGGGLYGGGGIYCVESGPTIERTLIRSNRATFGGGLHCNLAWPTFRYCVLTDNYAEFMGGAILCDLSHSPVFSDCDISNNSTDNWGGAAYLYSTTTNFENCVMRYNSAGVDGAAIRSHVSKASLRSCLVCNNEAGEGAILTLQFHSEASIENTTIVENTPRHSLITCEEGDRVTVENSILWDNGGTSIYIVDGGASLRYSCIEGLDDIVNNVYRDACFDADPLFADAPVGQCYLSCIEAGQEEDSPCIDAGFGSPAFSGLYGLTTRTDGEEDTDWVDIGFHYLPNLPEPRIDCSFSAYYETWPELTLVGELGFENRGVATFADVYVIFILGKDEIYSFTDQGFAVGLYPWRECFHLWKNYIFFWQKLFELEVSADGGLGPGLFVAVLTQPGTMRFICEPDIREFEITPPLEEQR